MTPTLQILLECLFDYAGLFPPAALPMEEAVEEYVRHVENPDEAWLAGCFVCPVAWLPEFAARPTPEESFLGLTVLGTSLEGLRQDQRAIESFLAEASDRFLVEAYEVKVGPHAPDAGTLKKLAKAGIADTVFLEVPWGKGVVDTLTSIAEADCEDLCAKARTGGLEASAFPSSQELAQFIKLCGDLELSYKLTAGLHHPIRRYDEGVGAWMHGFINVFMAGMMGQEFDLTESEIVAILDEEDASAFEFGDASVSWRKLMTDLEAIELYRENLLCIGSCSIREPIDDLSRLGWL